MRLFDRMFLMLKREISGLTNLAIKVMVVEAANIVVHCNGDEVVSFVSGWEQNTAISMKSQT